MKAITFITGNQHKADYYARLLDMPLTHQKLDLDEIQSGDITEVARHKIEQAYAAVQRPVIIDDFGFCITAFNNLPGPFTKFFVEPEDGLEKLCRITDAFESRAATIVCALAYKDAEHTRIFVQQVPGTVAQQPRGTLGIDTDRIFEPAGYGGRTRSELSQDEYDEVYMKVRPIEQLKNFLLTNETAEVVQPE